MFFAKSLKKPLIKGYFSVVISLLLFLFCFPTETRSQASLDESSRYQWFDYMIGIGNSGLYSGVVYKEKYLIINDKHKFFHSSNSLYGFISYDGQPHFDVPMKYDLYEDEVLVKFKITTLLLAKSKIDSFIVDNTKFLKINYEAKDPKDVKLDGFFELLAETSFYKLIKKHKKKKIERIGNKFTYYEFNDKNIYFLLYKNSYHKISTKSDIVKIFPQFKQEIMSYSNKSLRRRDKEAYLLDLLNRVSEIHSKTNLTTTE